MVPCLAAHLSRQGVRAETQVPPAAIWILSGTSGFTPKTLARACPKSLLMRNQQDAFRQRLASSLHPTVVVDRLLFDLQLALTILLLILLLIGAGWALRLK
jgi:hypothetical protein